MPTFKFYNSDDGRTYFVRGPASLTQEQAQRVFNEQKSVGALIGLEPTELITPEFQLANGLKTAESAVLTDFQSAAAQGVSATGFRLPSIPVTDGITSAEYAKQSTVAEGLGNLTNAELTGVLAQAHTLTKQAATEATNLGAGKYAFTVLQLEKVGYIKPGTNATYIEPQTVSTLGVLNRTVVWTGKDGVLSLQQLLQNESLQDSIQQQLMAAGLEQLTEVGIAVDSMPPQTQAGYALLSAISPELAVAYSQGSAPTTIPTVGNIPESSYWQSPSIIVRDAAYATEFSATKINNAMRNEISARGYNYVTERQAVDFAANQIVGNAKVPKISYGTDPVDSVLLDEFTALMDTFSTVSSRTEAVLAQTTTLANAASKEAQLVALRDELLKTTIVTVTNSTVATRLLGAQQPTVETGLRADLQNLIRRAEATAPVSPQFLLDLDAALLSITNLIEQINKELTFIARVLGRRTAR